MTPAPDEVVLVRTSADQLKEAQALVETQRLEIQSLWKQLTDLELERTTERTEMEGLRAELRTVKDQLASLEEQRGAFNGDGEQWEAERAHLVEEHQVAMAAMDTKFWASQKETQKARDQLKVLQEERIQAEELRQEDDRETKQRILSLESQLNGIRGLLNGARF